MGKTPKVILTRGKYWYWKLVAGNNQILLVSETYRTRWGAKRQAKKLAEANDFRYEEQ